MDLGKHSVGSCIPYTLVTGLTMPAIDLDSPLVGILPGETSAPDDAVGWLWGPSRGGAGCKLAGHRDKGSTVFGRLDELEAGDKIIVQDGEGRWYSYVVIEKLVVSPDDNWVLEGVRGKKLVTLMTCTPPGVNTHRLVVRRELKR